MSERPRYSPKKMSSNFYGNNFVYYRYNEHLDKDILYLNPHLKIMLCIIISTYFAYLLR